MNKMTLTLLAFALGLSQVGCDWIHKAFVNSIPFEGDASLNPDVYVYLCVDGLSYQTVETAMAASLSGSMQGGSNNGAGPVRSLSPKVNPAWRLAKTISAYPATSDYSWTRILRTEKMGGYEMEYFSPLLNKIINPGLLGVARHIMPNLAESFNFEEPYLKAFDYRANGYTSGYQVYRDTFISLADTLDELFFILEGRAETQSVFSAYLLEFDVMGHMQSSPDVSKAFKDLLDRIEEFKATHKNRRFHFTFITDHGMDFIPVKRDRLVDMSHELEKIGILPVQSFRGLKDSIHAPLVTIPIEHTRVTYVALHTLKSQTDLIAQKVSALEAVDLVTGQLDEAEPKEYEWFGVWSEGKRLLTFGFDSQSGLYLILKTKDFETSLKRLDLSSLVEQMKTKTVGNLVPFSNHTLFELTKHSKYPDLLYRIRTAHSKEAQVGAEHPSELLVSFRKSYASLGFKLTDSFEVTSAGYHGSLDEVGAVGALLTEERSLPDVVRGDEILNLFPRLNEHIKQKGLEQVAPDPQAAVKNFI